MSLKKKTAKTAVEVEFDRCYGIHGNCVQISIMDMGKLFAEATSPKEGQTIEDATKLAIAKYRKN